MSFIVYIYLITSLFYIYVGMATYIYDPSNKANRIFLVICLDLALWAIMLTLINAVSDAQAATDFRRTATFFWSTIYCLLLHFFLILTKKDNFLKNPVFLAILYLPALICIYLYYFYIPVSAKDIVKIHYSWAYLNPTGQGFLWDQFLNIYYISYSLASIALLYIWSRQSNIKREKRQAYIIIMTYVCALLLGSVTDIVLPNLGIPLFPPLAIFFILIPISGIWYSIKKYRLMNLCPENVVRDVMGTMGEGMIIIDDNRIVQDLNTGAEKMLGYMKDELKNNKVDIIFSERSTLDRLDKKTNEITLITKNNEQLPVLFSSTILSDKWTEPYGSVLIFQDLTETKRMQRKLQESYDEMEIKVHQRTKELEAANTELMNEIITRTNMGKEIEKLAYYDNLTGLPNRRLFSDFLTKTINNSLRNEHPFSIMFLDLDSFKMINDTLGHTQGDELLKEVAIRIAKTLRVTDTIGRIGGDEFCIIVQNTPDRQIAQMLAGKILDSFSKPFDISGNETHITASLGIAMFPIDGQDSDALIKNAEIAMYEAKEKGKNTYEICTQTMKDDLIEIMKLTNYLYRALEKNEFELYYQPQVDTYSDQIIGFEALLRWHSPKMGMISPSKFIPIAEKTGLIIPIGEWVLRTACRQNKIWHDQGLITVPVGVNLSVKQLMEHDLVDKVKSILNETGLDPCFLEMEITESVLMKEVDFISEALDSLNELGVKISIDDFGTEYSSLNYLKRLPIHKIKIAMTFVQGIAINQRDEAIINAIIALANNLGIGTIAEGVENTLQRDFLRSVKCDAIQGFYYYRPTTADGIIKLLK